ncbi:MAG TPA: serine/threonine-protein kinase, partial [Polyangiaceae bacterium]
VGGKYRIDGFLGAGGMGVVLSATHLELDAPVAIKIVRDDLAKDEQVVERLLFEARAVARMRSAHIVRVLDVAHLDSGAPYIVMEQLQGWDLQTVLAERGVLSVREAIRHILQACEGLAEAHGLGIVHRDLKPENLFLATTPEGVVLKILDFGISKDIGPAIAPARCSTLTKEGSAVGSPYYMSPEQMRASPTLDARADIWSLGAILFELLTGKCPFEADTPAQLCTMVMVDDAPSLRSFSSRAPAALDAIVRRCLQKEPSARFQTVTDLADALRDFVAEAERATAAHAAAEPTPTNFTPPEPTRAVAPRKLPRSWLLVGALLVSACLGYWHFRGSIDAPEWLGGQRANAAALSTVARSPQLQARAVASASVVVAPLATAPAAPTAQTTASRSVSPTPRAAVGPRFYIPPHQRAPAPTETPDSPAARYGL